jgi:hypothetical protein
MVKFGIGDDAEIPIRFSCKALCDKVRRRDHGPLVRRAVALASIPPESCAGLPPAVMAIVQDGIDDLSTITRFMTVMTKSRRNDETTRHWSFLIAF